MRVTRLTLLLLALTTISGFGLLTYYLLQDVENQSLQATEEALIDTAHVLAAIAEAHPDTDHSELFSPILAAAHKHEINARVFHHLKDNFGLGIYTTDTRGVITYHSDDPALIGTSFRHFNDVRHTLAGRYGARSTRADQLKKNSSIMFIAAPISRDNRIVGSLSVFKAQADVIPFITRRRQLITTSAVLIAAGIILFTGAVFVWLWQPVGRLTDYARSISQGERPDFPRLGRGREVNTLGAALRDMREALEGRRYTESYVSTLTHELKSPLAAIQGAAELLEEHMSSDQRSRFLRNIQRETHRSRKLIDGLLQLSSVESRSELERRETLQLDALVREVAEHFRSRARVKSLTLETKVQPCTITGDRAMLALAIGNLMENAIDFSPPGNEILLSLTDCVLTITNSGDPIPDFAQDRIFDRFYSLDRPGRPASKSTGLGLPFVKETAILHGGSIAINSTEGTVEAILDLTEKPTQKKHSSS